MGQFKDFAREIGDEKDKEGLDNQGNGDEYDVQGVLQNDLPLEGENDDQCQQQADGGAENAHDQQHDQRLQRALPDALIIARAQVLRRKAGHGYAQSVQRR